LRCNAEVIIYFECRLCAKRRRKRKADFNPKWNFSQFYTAHAPAFMFITQNISDTAIFITENIINIDDTTKQTRAINQPVKLIILVILPPHIPLGYKIPR